MHTVPSKIHGVITGTTSKIAKLPDIAPLSPRSSFVKSSWLPRELAAQVTEPTSLNALPLEVQVEILKELDWVDVLHVRQVSRSLFWASKERPVWTAISTRHEEEREPRSHVLEKRLSRHTATELEEAFLRPRRTQIAWDKSTQLTSRTVKSRPQETMYGLLPGGRWAITGDNTSGDINCYDLNSPLEPPPYFSLVPHPTSVGLPRCVVDLFRYRHKGPYLSFNLATYHTLPVVVEKPRNPVAPPQPTSHLQVFRVEPEFDGEGCVVRLSSTLLSAFDPGRGIFDLSLYGPYLSYLRDGSRCVVEWEHANNLGQGFPRRWVHCSAQLSNILPHDLLLVIDWRKILLYDIKATPLTTADRPTSDTIGSRSLLWDKSIEQLEDNWRGSVSGETTAGRVYFLHGSSRSRSFFIPNTPRPAPPSLVQFHVDGLSKTYQPRRYSHCMKVVEVLHNADGHKTLRRGRLIWPPEPDGSLRQATPFADIPLSPGLLSVDDWMTPCLSIDGVSGRVVVLDKLRGLWVIVSPAL